jgi:hypothetical protein
VQTDRDLLLNGLANVNGATDLQIFQQQHQLQLGNLVLYFDADGKFEKLRIRETPGTDRVYWVERRPIEP